MLAQCQRDSRPCVKPYPVFCSCKSGGLSILESMLQNMFNALQLPDMHGVHVKRPVLLQSILPALERLAENPLPSMIWSQCIVALLAGLMLMVAMQRREAPASKQAC